MRLFILIVTILHVVKPERRERDLIQALTQNYDKRLRPVATASQVLNITFGLALTQVIDVDEKNQLLTTYCWLNLGWLDAGLVWDPNDYDGINTILLPYDSVWLPDLILYNSIDIISKDRSSLSTNVIIRSDGNITWLISVMYKSSCAIKIRYFPFDEQNCSLIFASWSYDIAKLNLKLVSTKGDLSNYIRNSEFDLVDIAVNKTTKHFSCCSEPFSMVTYYISLRRRPLFFVVNMFLPLFAVTLVTLLGFYLPPDSGEKITMQMTTLLSMTIFLSLIADSMPPTSEGLPLLGIYYMMMIVIISIAIGMTVFTLNLYHSRREVKDVPGWVKRLCTRFIAPITCITDDQKTSNTNEPYEILDAITDANNHELQANGRGNHNLTKNDEETWRSLLGTHFGKECKCRSRCRTWKIWQDIFRSLKVITEYLRVNEARHQAEERYNFSKREWQQVALAVDRLLLLVFVSVTVGTAISAILIGVRFAWEHSG